MSLEVQSDVVIVRLCHLRYKVMLHCHVMSLQVQNDVVIVMLCHFRYKVMLSLSGYVT